MKTKVTLLSVLCLFAAFGWTFVKRPLPVPKAMGSVLPDAPSVSGVSLWVIRGAELTSQEGFSVRGGSLVKPFISGVASFMVEHPYGRLLIDAGVARDVSAHFQAAPLFVRALATFNVRQPTIDALAARRLQPGDLRAIVLTHSHWDHVSGLADLRAVPIWITPEELAHARSDDAGGALYRRLEAEGQFELNDLVFPDDAYGPFPASKDFFGDRTVVVVPMAGHTAGSVGVFINVSGDRRFLIIGDTAWTREGVDWPAEKPWLARQIADQDPAAVREQLVLLHQLQRANPNLVIVPAHDARAHVQIPSF